LLGGRLGGEERYRFNFKRLKKACKQLIYIKISFLRKFWETISDDLLKGYLWNQSEF
jgi:hypothetical protein